MKSFFLNESFLPYLRYSSVLWQPPEPADEEAAAAGDLSAASAATSLERSGMFALRKGRTKGRRGKLVTSCSTWWKSPTEMVPA